MADSKITALTENTTPLNTDVIEMVDDPGGTPANQKIQLLNLLKGCYTLVATLGSDAATGANTTPIDLTGLVWTYEANSIYYFRWIGSLAPAAATTGCGFQLNVSTAVTDIDMGFLHQLANTGTLSGGSSVADDASVGVSSGMPSASPTATPVMGWGLLRTGANTGTAQLRFRSETTAVTTAKAGMTLIVEKVA